MLIEDLGQRQIIRVVDFGFSSDCGNSVVNQVPYRGFSSGCYYRPDLGSVVWIFGATPVYYTGSIDCPHEQPPRGRNVSTDDSTEAGQKLAVDDYAVEKGISLRH